jgi:hypothetical protein
VESTHTSFIALQLTQISTLQENGGVEMGGRGNQLLPSLTRKQFGDKTAMKRRISTISFAFHFLIYKARTFVSSKGSSVIPFAFHHLRHQISSHEEGSYSVATNRSITKLFLNGNERFNIHSSGTAASKATSRYNMKSSDKEPNVSCRDCRSIESPVCLCLHSLRQMLLFRNGTTLLFLKDSILLSRISILVVELLHLRKFPSFNSCQLCREKYYRIKCVNIKQ